MFGAVDGRKNGRRKMAAAGQAEDPGPHVEVRAFQEGRAWKDHMGVARGFVEIIVEAHHAFEQGQRLCKLFRIRGAERGIGGKGQQALDLAFTRCRDFLCHRSEEHTSELQSLMRISYAVFCLKKKK